MRPINELINRDDPALPLIYEWLANATNRVEVLPPPDDPVREAVLYAVQVTTRSPMGAIIYETGGLLVDQGWLRILGSGHPRLPRSLLEWNQGRSGGISGEGPKFLLVADDALGGFFAIDGGGLGFEKGTMCYFAPDTLAWESMNRDYSDFLVWCLQGDLGAYYEPFRWDGWEQEVRNTRGDQAIHVWPPLFAKGPSIGKRNRRAIPISEVYSLYVGEGDG